MSFPAISRRIAGAYPVSVIKRTSIDLDLDRVEKAREILGTNGAEETIHRALDEVVRSERLRRLARHSFDDLTPEALAELRRTRL
jgi:Arc/MetJ family transcription regulator